MLCVAQAVAPNTSKAFGKVLCAGFLYKFKCYGIFGQVFSFALSFFSNRQLHMVVDRKSLEEWPINALFINQGINTLFINQGVIFGPTLSCCM